MDVNDKVIKNLESFGLTTDIKPVTLKHLRKVDEVLTSITQAQTEAIQEIKKNKVSINRVAKESGISRQTFYNNPILSAYVEAYIEQISISNPFETIARLREEIRAKDVQIESMVKRDANVSKCKAQIQELEDEISSLRETIKSQEDLIRQLQSDSSNIIHEVFS